MLHLQNGKRAEALALLNNLTSAESPEEAREPARRIAFFLQAIASPGQEKHEFAAYLTPPEKNDPFQEGGDPERQTATTLECIYGASQAVQEGRIDDLKRLCLKAVKNEPSKYPWISLRVGSILQTAFRFTADPEFFQLALKTCGHVADQVQFPSLAIVARALMGTIHVHAGNLHAAFERCDAAIQLASASNQQDEASVALAHQFKGYALFEWNRLAEAKSELERAWALTDETHAGVRSGVARTLTHLCTVLGDHAAADQWMTRLTEIVREPMTLRNREWLAAVRQKHALRKANLREIESWRRTFDYHPEELAKVPPDRIPARLQEYEHLLALLEAKSQWSDIRVLAPLVRHAARKNRDWMLVRALTTEAVALENTGDTVAADELWATALEVGEKGSFVRVYFEGSTTRTRLIKRAGKHPSTRQYCERINASFGRDADNDPTLTPAQTRVLKSVARGLSNNTVAEELGVSVTTVKTHLRAIYDRLGATSRTHAVAQARRIGILETEA